MSIPMATPADSQRAPQLQAARQVGTASASAEGVVSPSDAVTEATPAQIEQAVSEVNASLKNRSVGVQFEMDRDADKLIVKVVDRESGEVLRQIPSEEVVRIAKLLGKAPGLLVSHAA